MSIAIWVSICATKPYTTGEAQKAHQGAGTGVEHAGEDDPRRVHLSAHMRALILGIDDIGRESS